MTPNRVADSRLHVLARYHEACARDRDLDENDQALAAERADMIRELQHWRERVGYWSNARGAFLALPPGSPDARAALDRLANAEQALYAAARE